MWLGLVIVSLVVLFLALYNISNASSGVGNHPSGVNNLSSYHNEAQSREIAKSKPSNLRRVPIDRIDSLMPLGSKLRNKADEAWWQGEKYIYLTEEEFNQLNDAWHQHCDRELTKAKTRELESLGYKFEQEQLYEDAVKAYEECISFRQEDKDPYERLMILYRRLGLYEGEQRVAKIAIEVFDAANHRIAAYTKTQYPKFAKQIDSALETCENVKGDDGRIIFNPYKINKYRDRYAKTQLLIDKRNAKMKS